LCEERRSRFACDDDEAQQKLHIPPKKKVCFYSFPLIPDLPPQPRRAAYFIRMYNTYRSAGRMYDTSAFFRLIFCRASQARPVKNLGGGPGNIVDIHFFRSV
jgi:hypothetical protein